MNRRNFIGSASCAAVGSTTFFSTLFNLKSMAAAAPMQLNEDYKAVVCILLAGGNDSYNMLVPRENSAYQEYATTRSNLALAQESLLPLNGNNYTGPSLGLHPSMSALHGLFDDGKLAFINNVGTLIEPTTKNQLENNLVKSPVGLFSHIDQQRHWMTSIPDERAGTGWGGRLADMVDAVHNNSDVSMNISLSGKNIFQVGNEAIEYAILPTGTGGVQINGYKGRSLYDQVRTEAVQSLMEKQYQDLFKTTYADVVWQANNTNELFSKVVGNSELTTEFGASDFGQRMAMIARTINVRASLGLKRQTFFVTYNGWDHHDEVLINQQVMLGDLSASMKQFQDALGEMGLEDNVTTFVISDFARTLSSNGNGTDHAWGGNVMVMGGAVNGGDIYGQYPSLALRSDLEIGGGVIIPQLSTDQYFAELALWFGVHPSSLTDVLPNINRFYDTSSSSMPIGFMKSTI